MGHWNGALSLEVKARKRCPVHDTEREKLCSLAQEYIKESGLAALSDEWKKSHPQEMETLSHVWVGFGFDFSSRT